MNWNRIYTDLIRRGRQTYWGNWTLDPKIKVGAVGFVSPDSGDFTLVAEQVPNLPIGTSGVQNQWKMSSSDVHRIEANLNAEGSGTEPETGTEIKANFEVKWEFSNSESMASEFAIRNESTVTDLSMLSDEKTMQWLLEKARSVGMGGDGRIAQGFGVITSVINANSGLNVGSRDSNASFSLEGSASAVQEMLAGGSVGGGFTATRQHKSLDYHLWPHKPRSKADGTVPIAYTFASYEGSLLIPNWVRRMGSFEIFFNNKPGTTYVTVIKLRYSTPQGARTEEFTLSGGLSKTVGNIPLDATNIEVEIRFVGIINDDVRRLKWEKPLTQFPTGRWEVQMTGVWPAATDVQVFGR